MPVRGTPPNSAYYHTVCPSITAPAEVGLTHHRGGTAVAAGAPLGARGRLHQGGRVPCHTFCSRCDASKKSNH